MSQGQLPVPEAADSDRGAREIVRVWAAGGKQHVSLAANLWDDPAAWGLMLVDLARHVANAYEERGIGTRERTLERIWAGVEAERAHPTDTPTGSLGA